MRNVALCGLVVALPAGSVRGDLNNTDLQTEFVSMSVLASSSFDSETTPARLTALVLYHLAPELIARPGGFGTQGSFSSATPWLAAQQIAVGAVSFTIQIDRRENVVRINGESI